MSDGCDRRNLYRRGGIIYYERVWLGRRYVVSTRTGDWLSASLYREVFEGDNGIGHLHGPTLSQFAFAYLDNAVGRLAPSSFAEQERLLLGDLATSFGGLKLGEITADRLRAWWVSDVVGRRRSPKTGREMIGVLRAVFDFACWRGDYNRNPVDEFRAILRREAMGLKFGTLSVEGNESWEKTNREQLRQARRSLNAVRLYLRSGHAA